MIPVRTTPERTRCWVLLCCCEVLVLSTLQKRLCDCSCSSREQGRPNSSLRTSKYDTYCNNFTGALVEHAIRRGWLSVKPDTVGPLESCPIGVVILLHLYSIFYEKMKNVSCEYDRWVVETQLCKLRDTSDTLYIQRSQLV